MRKGSRTKDFTIYVVNALVPRETHLHASVHTKAHCYRWSVCFSWRKLSHFPLFHNIISWNLELGTWLQQNRSKRKGFPHSEKFLVSNIYSSLIFSLCTTYTRTCIMWLWFSLSKCDVKHNDSSSKMVTVENE